MNTRMQPPRRVLMEAFRRQQERAVGERNNTPGDGTLAITDGTDTTANAVDPSNGLDDTTNALVATQREQNPSGHPVMMKLRPILQGIRLMEKPNNSSKLEVRETTPRTVVMAIGLPILPLTIHMSGRRTQMMVVEKRSPETLQKQRILLCRESLSTLELWMPVPLVPMPSTIV